jgi:hypothetical protein
MAYVYRHIRLDENEPFYIGIGKLISRAYSKKNRNLHWRNIVKNTKYDVEIIFDDLSWEDACNKEKEFIKIYGRRDLNNGSLCNLTDGGDGTINTLVSDERKIQMSLNAKGNLNSFYRKKHSDETKKTLSQKAKGRKIDVSTKEKISNSLKGENNYWYGKKLSDEHKLKLSNKATGRICDENQKNKLRENSPRRIEIHRIVGGELFIYKSLREAQQKTGYERKYIKKYMKELGFQIMA